MTSFNTSYIKTKCPYFQNVSIPPLLRLQLFFQEPVSQCSPSSSSASQLSPQPHQPQTSTPAKQSPTKSAASKTQSSTSTSKLSPPRLPSLSWAPRVPANTSPSLPPSSRPTHPCILTLARRPHPTCLFPSTAMPPRRRGAWRAIRSLQSQGVAMGGS